MTLLRNDIDIKSAFAEAIGRPWQQPNERDGASDRLALREICLPPEKTLTGIGLPERDPEEVTPNAMCAEVFTFCPVALPGWQEQAREVLEEHKTHWREELSRVQGDLANHTIYALPFGRFLEGDGCPEHWISDVESKEIVLGKVFKECAPGVTAESKYAVWYFRRPYILWPLRPGTFTHVTLVEGSAVEIKRMPLYDERLEKGRRDDPAPEPPRARVGWRGLWRR